VPSGQHGHELTSSDMEIELQFLASSPVLCLKAWLLQCETCKQRPIITGQSFWCQADSVSLTAMPNAQFQKKKHPQQAETSLATDTQTRGPSCLLKMVCKTPSGWRVYLICCGIRGLLPNCMLKPEAASALPHGWAPAM